MPSMSTEMETSRREGQRLNEFVEDLSVVRSTRQGRRFVRWIIERSGVFLSANDPAFDPGKRELGLELINALSFDDPYALPALLKEGADDVVRMKAAERRKANDAEDDV